MSFVTPAPFAYLATSTIISFISASGGTITTSGSYKIHTFTTTGSNNFTIHTTGSSPYNTVELLVVAGGGGGGGNQINADYYAGGGGAGGLFYTSSYPITSSGTITADVGAGGAKATVAFASIYNESSTGSNSSFASLITYGGGNVGSNNAGTAGGNGGSGGGANGETCPGAAGACSTAPGGIATQPTSSTGGFGNNGGVKSNCGNWCGFPYTTRNVSRKGGSGGGAGSAAAGTTPGTGRSYDFTGTSITYAAGGAAVASSSGSLSTANSGNGGDGFFDGASGVVIVKYRYQ